MRQKSFSVAVIIALAVFLLGACNNGTSMSTTSPSSSTDTNGNNNKVKAIAPLTATDTTHDTSGTGGHPHGIIQSVAKEKVNDTTKK